MTKPNFIIVGAAKCGTTSLYHYLKQHPEVYMSPLKETRYFLFYGERPEAKGRPGAALKVRESVYTLEAYHALFQGATTECALGEASPAYLPREFVAKRIHEYDANMKIVVTIRQPVDRAYSHYLWRRTSGIERHPTLEGALAWEANLSASHWNDPGYLDTGYYARHLQAYYDLFSKEQIKVVLFDNFVRDPVSSCQEIFGFLGVDETFEPDVKKKYFASGTLPNPVLQRMWEKSLGLRDLVRPLLSRRFRRMAFEVVQKRTVKERLPPEERAALTELYRTDIEKLEDMLGRDLSHWIK